MLNSSASKAPITAVSTVRLTISVRRPRVAAQTNGKNPRGGCGGGPAG